MKKTFIIVCGGFLLISLDLSAQDKGSFIEKESAPPVIDFEPLNFDSLEASLDNVMVKAHLSAKNLRKRKQVFKDNIDPNMSVYKYPKDYNGTLRIIELPKNYPSRMPIIELKERNQPGPVILPKK